MPRTMAARGCKFGARPTCHSWSPSSPVTTKCGAPCHAYHALPTLRTLGVGHHSRQAPSRSSGEGIAHPSTPRHGVRCSSSASGGSSSSGGAANAGASTSDGAHAAGGASAAGSTSGFDPSLSVGFQPPPGEPQLWWVEKFEARRLAEQQRQQQGQQPPPQQQAAREAIAAVELPTGSAAPPAGRSTAPRPSVARVVLQLVQLTAVVGALICWPAATVPGGLYTGRVWLLAAAYWLFFAAGSVTRLLQHGALAARARDAQGSSWGARIAWLAFVVVLPTVHWTAVRRFTSAPLPEAASMYDLVGGGLVCAACALHAWAARHLGAAFDRLVTPAQLVSSGPYALCQHPIYGSYMMLFVGCCLELHSASCAAALLAVCVAYYSVRTRLEARLLSAEFGEAYQEYVRRVPKRYVPWVW